MSRLVGSEVLSICRDQLGSALEAQMRRISAPEERKSDKPLRRFSIREMANLCLRVNHNTTRHYLKTIPNLPEGMTESGGRKTYSLEEIHEVQRLLADAGKLPQDIIPWRLPGEPASIILVYNLKGGVAKSTLTANTAELLAARGFRVLLLDLDPQASLSDLFDVKADLDDIPSVYDMLRYDTADIASMDAADVIRATYFPNLDLIPGSLALSEFEFETSQAATRGIPFYKRLDEKLSPVLDHYDVVLIDSPPHLSFSVIAAIYACTGMLIPTSAGMLDVVSLEKFLDLASGTLASIEEAAGAKKIDFVRFVLTRYQPSDPAQLQLSSFIRSTLGDAMLMNDMLASTAIADAGNTMNPLLEIEPGEFTRKTYDRILESLQGIALEIEEEIMISRGRKPAHRRVA